jgi:hypothetical protein
MRVFAILLLLMIGVVVVPVTAQDCVVSENYIEAFGENRSELLRISVLLNTGGGALNDDATAAVNYKLLMSVRHYHQDARATLPECAQSANTAMLDAVSAAEDAFAMLFLDRLADDGSYTDDLTRTIADFRVAFGALQSTVDDAALQVASA